MAQNCYNERGQETSFLLKGSQSRTRWWTWHDFMMTEGAFLITINILSRPAIILCSFSLFFFLSRMTASLCLWLYGSPLLGKVSGLISDIRLLNTVACLSWSIVLIRFHGLHLDKFIWDVGNCISELHFIIKLCWNNYFLHLWKSLMNTELGFVFFFPGMLFHWNVLWDFSESPSLNKIYELFDDLSTLYFLHGCTLLGSLRQVLFLLDNSFVSLILWEASFMFVWAYCRE